MIDNYSYFAEVDGYKLYRNSEGFIEGFKKLKDGIDRIVTKARTISEFEEYIKPKEKTINNYNPYNDPNQLRID